MSKLSALRCGGRMDEDLVRMSREQLIDEVQSLYEQAPDAPRSSRPYDR